MRAVAAALVAAFAVVAAPAAAQDVPEPRLIARVEFPAGIAFDRAGRMYVSERAGRIRVVDDGQLLDEPLAEIPTTTTGETGLLGIAVSPDDDYVYAFATHPNGGVNRIWRVPTRGGRPEIVVDGLPAALYHNGGGVAFDRDGMLLVSNGEQHDDDRAQDPDQLGGKVYRFTPDGDVAPNNPFGDSPAFAIGLRNPYGLTVDHASGEIYVTENGPTEWDEVNRIERGGNYGWPDVSGPSGGARPGGPGDYREPLQAYEAIIVPTGIAVADPRTAQRAYRGDVFFGTFADATVRRLQLDRSGAVVSDTAVVQANAGVVGVAWGPRGLYYSTTDAVYVVPIARRRTAASPTQPAPSPSPTDAAPRTTTPGPEEDNGVPVALVVGGIVVAVVVAAVVILRR